MASSGETSPPSNEVTSLKTLFELHSPSVFSYLLRLSGDRALAQDLTSETFYKAILAIDSFRGDASVKTWLLRIARNLYLRHAKREQRNTSLETMQAEGVSFITPQPGPEAEVIQKERDQAIQKALLRLSENDRTILLLTSQENMAYREIGEVLEISVSAVKVRIHRARQRFAIALNEIVNPQKE
jgi:RNA polymerase sigma-70 factor (ECF subfamily)